MSTPEFDLERPSSLVEASALLHAGNFTSVQLCESLLEHIHSQNDRILAVRTVFAQQALTEAAEVDRKRACGILLSPLAGIPILVKENIDVLPGPVSAGHAFLETRVPAREAWIVERLRSAGAVILGTTVSDPGAFGVRTEAVQHPMNPMLTVGGSSGGSGAALAAGFAYAALGTDTGGSVRIPSACCGVAGLKPTSGTWKTDGVYPLVRDLDHVGPMARTVGDLIEVWHALTPDALHYVATPSPLRIGWCPEWLAVAQSDVQSAFDRSLRLLSDQGHLVSEVRLPDLDDVARAHFTHFCHAACQLHLDEFGYKPYMFSSEAQAAFSIGSALSSIEILQAEQIRTGLKTRVDSALSTVDFLMLPSLPVHRPELATEMFQVGSQSRGFTATLVLFTSLFNHTGHPALSTPAPGTLPAQLHSVQWVGSWGTESRLLAQVDHVLKQCS